MASSKGERCVRAGDTSDPKADIRFSFLHSRKERPFPIGAGSRARSNVKANRPKGRDAKPGG